MKREDLMWLAGLLEGEGCFTARPKGGNPKIYLCMTDLDVMERAGGLLETSFMHKRKKQKEHHKEQWMTSISGKRAISMLEQLLPLMGIRRSQKIKELLEDYPKRPKRNDRKKRWSGPLTCGHDVKHHGLGLCYACYQKRLEGGR